jgi:hypothetical protein
MVSFISNDINDIQNRMGILPRKQLAGNNAKANHQ